MKTQLYYEQKANEVKSYVCNNLHKELNTKQLSEQFGISYFHFHRLMKAALKQPLLAYISNLRFEIALKSLRSTQNSIGDIALLIGYNDVSAFSKAFTKEFGVSPQEFRLDTSLELNTQIDYRYVENDEFTVKLKPKRINMVKKQIYYIEVIDKYGGKKTEEAWSELENFAQQNKLFGWKPDVFSLYYDEPDEVGEYNCRAHLCIASSKDIPLLNRIRKRVIDGGNYQVFRYKGPWEQLWQVYDRIYADLIAKGGFVLRDTPILEKYLSFAKNTKPENLLTEIYLPIIESTE